MHLSNYLGSSTFECVVKLNKFIDFIYGNKWMDWMVEIANREGITLLYCELEGGLIYKKISIKGRHRDYSKLNILISYISNNLKLVNQ